jgi:hypothetical protein
MKRAGMGLLAVAVLAVVAGGAFWAGTRVGENRALQDPARLFQQRFRGQEGAFPGVLGTPPAEREGAQLGREGALRIGGGILGTIEEIEGNTLVIDTGQETIHVQTTDTTLIEKSMTVTVGDLEIGEQVTVAGSRNEDGSLTARSIRSMRGFQFPETE